MKLRVSTDLRADLHAVKALTGVCISEQARRALPAYERAGMPEQDLAPPFRAVLTMKINADGLRPATVRQALRWHVRQHLEPNKEIDRK